MITEATIFPGDQITACGFTFTVWSILYQDCCPSHHDVEFIDDSGKYHHWEEDYDGGHVIRSGKPGLYYRETSGATDDFVIACIMQQQTGPGFTAKIMYQSGPDIFLGYHDTEKNALDAIRKYSETYGYNWKEM